MIDLRRGVLAALLALGAAGGVSAQEHPTVQAAERIRAEVARMRGLEYQAAVRVGVKTPAELRAMFLGEFEDEMPVEEVAKQEKVFKRLGLIPQDFDLRTRLIEFLAENVGGYYDPEKKELFLIDQSQNPEMQALGPAARFMDEMVMAHELHHALQDQNFDLTRWMELLSSHDDRLQGYKSLIEGEAQLIGMQYLFKKMGRGDVDIAQFNRMQEMAARFSPEAAKLREMPPFLVENMMFPYTQGAEFVQRMQREQGWDRIGAAFDDPPTSTEQVLHPEKFLTERDDPMELMLPDFAAALGEGAEELYENTLGEFNVVLLLRALGLPKAEAARAAAGWDGDRFKGYETKDGRVVVVWLSTWDSEAEAREFEAAYTKAARGAAERRATPEEAPALSRRGFAALKYEPRFVTLTVMTGRPPREDFTGEAAPEATETPAPAAAAAPALLRSESVGATFVAPEGFTLIEEPVQQLRQMGAATLQGPNGERLRLLRLPIPLGQADEQVKALITQGVPDVEIRGQDRTRILGRDALWVDFVGTLPGDKAKSSNRGLVIDLGVDSVALGASVPDGQQATPQALIEAFAQTLWLDGSRRPGAQSTTAGPASFETPEGFVEARTRQGEAVLCTLEHPTGAKVQVVRAPAQGALEERARALEAQLPLALEGFRARSAGMVSRQGRPAHEMDFEAGGRRTRQVTFDVDGQRYTIACSAPSDRFGEHLTAFGRALATFAVGGQQQPTQPPAPQQPQQPQQPQRERRAY
jgi:hypothetical protein